MIHGKHPCKSCPFRQKLVDGVFSPEVLEETVGANIERGLFAHRCHRTLGGPRENVCVGFLRHVRDHDIPNRLVSMGQVMGIIDYDQISDDVPIAGSWEEALENHARALKEVQDAE